jgi:hypothetical protein
MVYGSNLDFLRMKIGLSDIYEISVVDDGAKVDLGFRFCVISDIFVAGVLHTLLSTHLSDREFDLWFRVMKSGAKSGDVFYNLENRTMYCKLLAQIYQIFQC